eukprot:scaffold417_cov97-Cylindrotheca_fusiformis.AAC.4
MTVLILTTESFPFSVFQYPGGTVNWALLAAAELRLTIAANGTIGTSSNSYGTTTRPSGGAVRANEADTSSSSVS